MITLQRLLTELKAESMNEILAGAGYPPPPPVCGKSDKSSRSSSSKKHRKKTKKGKHC